MESIEAHAAVSPVLSVLRWWDFGVLMGLGAIGAWASRSNWRRLSLLYATFGALAGSIVLFFVLGRYRFPLVPLVALFAAAGLQTLWELRRSSRPTAFHGHLCRRRRCRDPPSPGPAVA